MYHKKDNLGEYSAHFQMYEGPIWKKIEKRFYHSVVELELVMEVSKKYFDPCINKNIPNNKHCQGGACTSF